ncbi:MAG: hypothetical protein H6662_15480 [Ardenticatenaceae bacterium]|nr:hypothetical protein [Anaerolineales bacterium]MCB8922988.1 hypothetical protein [Ardenticatenaceae bacterium]MCB8990279.1 hypothetical protein [Ardenticatenaceae bacterium]
MTTIDSLYRTTGRAITGIIGGFLLWVAPGIILTMLISWFAEDLWSYSETLWVWIIVPALVGGLIGIFLQVGGGFISGMVTGSFVGWAIWSIVLQNPAPGYTRGEAFYTGNLGYLLMWSVFFGSLFGALGGTVGGFIAGIAGESPAPTKESGLLGCTTIIAVPIAVFSFIYFREVIFGIAYYILNGEEPANNIEVFWEQGLRGALIAFFVAIVLFYLMTGLDKFFFKKVADRKISTLDFSAIRINLINDLIPLLLGLGCEILANTVVRRYFGQIGIGVGALLGAGLGTLLQNSLFNVADSGESAAQRETAKRNHFIKGWTSIIAAVIVATIQQFVPTSF